jgi:hypothetical protein
LWAHGDNVSTQAGRAPRGRFAIGNFYSTR